MKAEYDFRRGKRGQFYKPGATIKLPVYLDSTVAEYLSDKANRKGIELSDLVNDLLRKEIDIIESVK